MTEIEIELKPMRRCANCHQRWPHTKLACNFSVAVGEPAWAPEGLVIEDVMPEWAS